MATETTMQSLVRRYHEADEIARPLWDEHRRPSVACAAWDRYRRAQTMRNDLLHEITERRDDR